MRIQFNLHFHSLWGQKIFLVGNDSRFGQWDTNNAIALQYVEAGLWATDLQLSNAADVEYKYFIREADGFINWESGENRYLPDIEAQDLIIEDNFRPCYNPQQVLNRKAFTEVIMKPAKQYGQQKRTHSKAFVRFTLNAPRIGKDYGMAIIGDPQGLGEWENPIKMANTDYPIWQVDIDRKKLKETFQYKYAIISLKDGHIVTWEDRLNREVSLNMKEDCVQVINDNDFKYPNGNWKGAGVAVPIFSLRSEFGFGTGEFLDLKKLADWCALTGIKMIQVLPINDTSSDFTWNDSYPYKAISVRALHPMYLNLSAMGELYEEEQKEHFEKIRNNLNALDFMDYPEMFRAKWEFFKLLYAQDWEALRNKDSYLDFFKENEKWLKPYAAFCCLRDKFGTSDFHLWGDYAVYSQSRIEQLCTNQPEKVGLYFFLQYHLDQQLREAVQYLHSKGIALKGDIPIGISPNSVEAWSEPELFNLDAQAGAPPDDFAVYGQNWGFPTYNWPKMAENNYFWWRKRLSAMAEYFDAFRIDHILGFFRIWEIPMQSVQGIMGHFKPALPLSVDEIQHYGLHFDADRFVKPYIRGHFLFDFFGSNTENVRHRFLNELSYDVFELKPEFDTQRKIKDYFDQHYPDLSEEEQSIRDGLMGLASEVLFVKDPYSEGYHPRIALQNTYSYRELNSQQQSVFNKLYDEFFYHRHDAFWKEQALQKLPCICSATDMLVCGEDLGMVPNCVPEVMKTLNILSLEVQRMPKNPKIEFVYPAGNPYLSVDTTSTHDMSTIRGWWEEDGPATNRFFHHLLGHKEGAPFFAEPWVIREIIQQHLFSPSIWAIFPIQDLLAMDGDLRWDNTQAEQINVPANPHNHWKYRMVVSLEDLIQQKEFNQKLNAMITESGRNTDY